jgi:hypothetical protein
MSLWSVLKKLVAPAQIATRADLKDFMESRAAYLVQKSIMEYVQARANMMFSTLMSEKSFLAAYETARWASYPAALSWVAEMIEGTLRSAESSNAVLYQQSIAAIASDIVSAFPLPDGFPPRFWADALDALERDLGQAGLGPPKQAHEIPLHRAREIFQILPVHQALRQYDFTMFSNTLRFHLTEIASEFEERADKRALVAALGHNAGQAGLPRL